MTVARSVLRARQRCAVVDDRHARLDRNFAGHALRRRVDPRLHLPHLFAGRFDRRRSAREPPERDQEQEYPPAHDGRQPPPRRPPGPDRAVAGHDPAVGPAEQPQAEPARCSFDEGRGLGPRHCRHVVDQLLTEGAAADAVVAVHVVPGGRARGGDGQRFEQRQGCWQGGPSEGAGKSPQPYNGRRAGFLLPDWDQWDA